MSTWRIEWDDRARKELRSLDNPIQQRILRYTRERLSENPRRYGHELVGDKAGLWRYRIEDYRLICRLKDNDFVVLVVAVGHRREIYD